MARSATARSFGPDGACMQDFHPASVIAGACILLIVALLPVRRNSGKRYAVFGFIFAAVATLCILNMGLDLAGYVVDCADEQILKANLDQVRSDYAGHVPRNLVVIEGSSQTALALDAQAIEEKLRGWGYDVTVVDLAISGGNLLERYTLMQRFTMEMRRRGLPYASNTRLLFELHPDYDHEPLRFFAFYEDTLQTYHYSEFSNLLYAWRAYRGAGGALDKQALSTFGDFLSHCIVWTFKIGLLPKMQKFDLLTPMQAFTPYDGPVKTNGYNRRAFPDLVAKKGTKGISAQAMNRRVQRVTSLFGDGLSGYGYFLIPSLDRRKMNYGHAVCARRLAPVCIDASDPSIYKTLDASHDYYNRDHLNREGARIYSDYFARQLVADQVVVK